MSRTTFDDDGRRVSATEAAARALDAVLKASLAEYAGRDVEGPADLDDLSGPVCILRTVRPDLVGQVLSVKQWDWEAPHRLELYLSTRHQIERDDYIDDFAIRAGDALLADPKLGGAVDYAELGPPDRDAAEDQGVEPLWSAAFTLTLQYCSDRASG